MASVLWRQCSVNFSSILPTGCSLSWTASIWVSYGVQSSQRLPASARTSVRVVAFFGYNRLLWCGVLHRIQVGICSTVNLHGLQGLSLPSQHRLQENLCSVPLPPTPLLHCLCCPCGCSTPIPPLSIIKKNCLGGFASEICYCWGASTIADWLSLGQKWVWLWSYWSFKTVLAGATSVVPSPTTKALLHTNQPQLSSNTLLVCDRILGETSILRPWKIKSCIVCYVQ